jgi:hypothetical protein
MAQAAEDDARRMRLVADVIVRHEWRRVASRPRYLRRAFRRDFDATLEKFLRDKPGVHVRRVV